MIKYRMKYNRISICSSWHRICNRNLQTTAAWRCFALRFQHSSLSDMNSPKIRELKSGRLELQIVSFELELYIFSTTMISWVQAWMRLASSRNTLSRAQMSSQDLQVVSVSETETAISFFFLPSIRACPVFRENENKEILIMSNEMSEF